MSEVGAAAHIWLAHYISFSSRQKRFMTSHHVRFESQLQNHSNYKNLFSVELQISKRPLPVPPSVSPSDEYEVADLYDTIDDNAQKRLRKLAKMCSQQPKRDQIDVVEELYEEFDEDAESELPDASNPQGLKYLTTLICLKY